LRFPSNIPGLPGHNWANAISMATPIAHKGATAGAKVQAMTLLDLLLRPELVQQAWDYFRNEQTKDVKYEPLIRAQDQPAIWLNKATMEKYRAEMRKYYYDPSGETDLALRYDLTVPLARVVAENRGQLPKFFKRYQIQPVWRADRPARGRFREFFQCDVDAIGSASAVVEVEMIAAVSEVLQTLGFTDFVVQLNHRQLLSAMLDGARVAAERQNDAMVAIDKLDKIGRDGVKQELIARGIDGAAADQCLRAFEDVQEYDALAGRSE